MKILLIESPCNKLDNDKIDPPLGLLSIATYLRKENIDCEVLDLSSKTSEEWDKLIGSGYDFIGFRTLCVSYNDTLQIRDIAKKKNPKAVTVAGGPQASSIPLTVSNDFDYVITGEGEVTLANLIKSQKQDKITHGKLIPINESFADYSLININDYARILDGKKAIAVLTSRGCGYDCSYCNSSVSGFSPLRTMDEEILADNLKKMIREFEIKSFKFIDDNFLGGYNFEERAHNLNEYIAPLKIDFRCYLRVDQSNSISIQYLKNCGCKHITFGIESGDDKVLSTMKRGYTSKDIVKGVNCAYSSGMVIRICLMVGFPPYESDETVNNTLDIINHLKFHEYFVYPFLPYPGCDVERNPDKYQIKNIDRDFSKYLQIGKGRKSGYVFSAENFGPSDIERWLEKIDNELSKKGRWFGYVKS